MSTTKSTRPEQNSNTLVELRELRGQRGSGAACSQSPSAVCWAKTRYTVARLTPRVWAIVLADSPLRCIRWAKAAFDLSSALGRPMCCPLALGAALRQSAGSPPSTRLQPTVTHHIR
jgi:hypothetical protein